MPYPQPTGIMDPSQMFYGAAAGGGAGGGALSGPVPLYMGQMAGSAPGTSVAGVGQMGVKSPYSQFRAQMPQLQQYGAMQGLSAQAGNDAAARQQQNLFIAAMQQQAAGQGPSAARGMLNQATQQNIQNTAGAVAGNRTLSPAQAARLNIEAGANAQGQAAGQAATMRSQEQLNAQGMLGQAIAGQRQQDQGQFSTLAGLQLGQQQQQLAGSLGVQGLNQRTDAENLLANLEQQKINQGQQQTDINMWGGIANGAGQGLATAAAWKAGGGLIPGRAEMPGDSYANDTVDAKLSPGEIVLPRHVTQAPDAPERARRFVEALQMRKRGAWPVRRMADGGDATGLDNDPDYAAAERSEQAPNAQKSGGGGGGDWLGDIIKIGAAVAPYVAMAAARGGEVPDPAGGRTIVVQPQGDHVNTRGAPPQENTDAFRRMLMGVGKPVVHAAMGAAIDPDAGGMPDHSAVMMPGGGSLQIATTGSPPEPVDSGSMIGKWITGGAGMFNDDVTVPRPVFTPRDAPASQGVHEMLAAPPPDAPPGVSMPAAPAAAPPADIGAPSRLGRAFQSEEGAVRDRAYNEHDALAKIAQEKDAAAKAELGRAADLQSFIKQRYDEGDATRKAIASGTIDPNHWYSQIGTGGKIASVIGMTLGGIGAGLTHQRNQAADIITGAIDRDIESQKLNLDNKRNMLGVFMKQTGDMEASKHIVYAHEIAATQGRIEAEMTRMGSANALAAGQELIAQLERKRVEETQLGAARELQNREGNLQLQQMQARMKYWQEAISGPNKQFGNPAAAMLRLSFFEHPEKMAEHDISVDENVPSGVLDKSGAPVMTRQTVHYLGKSPGDAKEANDALAKNRMIDEQLQKLEAYQKNYPTGQMLPTTEAGNIRAATEFIRTNLESALAGMNRQASESVKNSMDEIVKDPSSLNLNTTRVGALKLLRSLVNEHKRSTITAHSEGRM